MLICRCIRHRHTLEQLQSCQPHELQAKIQMKSLTCGWKNERLFIE